MRLKNIAIVVLAIIIVILAGLLGYKWNKNNANTSTIKTSSATSHILDGVDHSVFQAVFLNNNQVYFGHLSSNANSDYVLTDVYYLRDKSSSNSSLVKLGSESHQPQDKMTIPKDSVSFWENLQHANQFNGELK